MTETFDSLLMPVEEALKLRSQSTRFTGPHLAIGVMADTGTTQYATALSPPPTPRTGRLSPRPYKLSLKLGSPSGLALHTNQAAFRQYTDYNSDGSPSALRSPTSGPGIGAPDAITSIDEVSAADYGGEVVIEESPTTPSAPVLDLFHRDVIRAALSTPAAGQRICAFAQTRNRGADVEFLLKVEEYLAALKYLTGILNAISSTFTCVTATSPVVLPHELSNNINVHIKHFARSMLPLLERMFRDATTAIEDRIARDVYPDFLKCQFSQCMVSSLSTSRSLTGGYKTAYPGLGNAFCLTDPSKDGHPMVYTSDGLLRMSGYQRHELLGRNCRIFQGLSTSDQTMRRISEAMISNREISELILNHKRDGSAYWNLLFVTPLVEKGKVRYFLGAQINVTESMGMQYKDILQILNFGPALGDGQKAKGGQAVDERGFKRMSGTQDKGDGESSMQSSDPRRRSERNFFRSLARKSTQFAQFSPFTGQPSRPGLTRPDTSRGGSDEKDERDANSSRPPTRRLTINRHVVVDEAHTPYSIFFVLGYLPPASTRLPVTFMSARALALLGLESRQRDAVLGKDVFMVLADLAGSPTVSRTLKSAVRDRLNAGETISVDVLVHADPSARQSSRRVKKTSMLGLSTANTAGLGISVDQSEPSRDAPLPPYLSSLTSRTSEDRGSGGDTVSGFFGPKMRRLISHWTPLKGAEGKTGWVMLVMTPAAS